MKREYRNQKIVVFSTIIQVILSLLLFLLMCTGLIDLDLIYSTVTHAMEPDNSSYNAFISKYNSVQDKVEYYTDQVRLANEDFKTALNNLNNLPPNQTEARAELIRNIEDIRESMKDSQTNLSSEQRMLRILDARKEAGDYTVPSSSSTATKRSFNQ